MSGRRAACLLPVCLLLWRASSFFVAPPVQSLPRYRLSSTTRETETASTDDELTTTTTNLNENIGALVLEDDVIDDDFVATVLPENTTFEFVPAVLDEGECLIGTERNSSLGVEYCLPLSLATLPRHSDPDVSRVLAESEAILREMHVNSDSEESTRAMQTRAKEAAQGHERIYANNYVNLGKIDT